MKVNICVFFQDFKPLMSHVCHALVDKLKTNILMHVSKVDMEAATYHAFKSLLGTNFYDLELIGKLFQVPRLECSEKPFTGNKNVMGF